MLCVLIRIASLIYVSMQKYAKLSLKLSLLLLIRSNGFSSFDLATSTLCDKEGQINYIMQ